MGYVYDKIGIIRNIRTVNISTSANINDDVLVVDLTSGPKVLTLPVIDITGRAFRIIAINGTLVNQLTIAPGVGNTIAGNTMFFNNAVEVIADTATNWLSYP